MFTSTAPLAESDVDEKLPVMSNSKLVRPSVLMPMAFPTVPGSEPTPPNTNVFDFRAVATESNTNSGEGNLVRAELARFVKPTPMMLAEPFAFPEPKSVLGIVPDMLDPPPSWPIANPAGLQFTQPLVLLLATLGMEMENPPQNSTFRPSLSELRSGISRFGSNESFRSPYQMVIFGSVTPLPSNVRSAVEASRRAQSPEVAMPPTAATVRGLPSSRVTPGITICASINFKNVSPSGHFDESSKGQVVPMPNCARRAMTPSGVQVSVDPFRSQVTTPSLLEIEPAMELGSTDNPEICSGSQVGRPAPLVSRLQLFSSVNDAAIVNCRPAEPMLAVPAAAMEPSESRDTDTSVRVNPSDTSISGIVVPPTRASLSCAMSA